MTEPTTAKRFLNLHFTTGTQRIALSVAFLVLLFFEFSKTGLAIRTALTRSTPVDAKTQALPGNRAIAQSEREGTFNSLRQAFAEAHSPQSSLPQAILLANDGATEDKFGNSVALSGDTAVVGSWFIGGAAYVFVRNGQNWMQQQKLMANDEEINLFGFAVAISGNTIVITSPGQGAYVFVRNGVVWELQQKLTVPALPSEGFGFSVAISGNSIVVGATDDNNSVGSAYVFVRDGVTWSQQQHIVVSGVLAPARIGRSVAIDGDTIVLGAPGDFTGSGTTGSAYVFFRIGTVWALQQQLLANDGLNNGAFGISVDLNGDTVVIGGIGRRAAYVFIRTGTTWTQQQKLVASDDVASNGFGYSVAIRGDSLVVGARAGSSFGPIGSAYLFTRSGVVWAHKMKFLAIDGLVTDSFGQAVDLDDSSVLVGAPFDDVATTVNRGSAYIFSRSCEYSISTAGQTVPAVGGTGSISVTAGANCAWSAVSNASWISLAENSGTGNGTVNFLVTANSSSARTGTIIAAGQVFTVMQNSGCTLTVTPVGQVFSEAGGSGNLMISSNGLCPWTALSNDSWITIPGGGSGNGTSFLTYSVAAFAGGTRTGTMTVAGQMVTIVQTSDCGYAISPVSQNIAAFDSAGNVSVFTRPSCNWTATSNVPWLSVAAGASGTGNGTVSINTLSNPSPAPRTGTMTIAGQTFTVNQAGNCSFAVTAFSQTVGPEGGSGMASVSTLSTCPWTAQSNVAWITVTSGATSTGNGTVNFTVAPNQGVSRTGQLTIAGQSFYVTQSGKLVYYPLPYPVRLHDSRPGFPDCSGPDGPIQGGTSRRLFGKNVPCNGLTIPFTALALTGNITTVQSGGGYLTLYPGDAQQPVVANSNYLPNEVVNNVFTVGIDADDGEFKIFASSTTDVVVDVTGYYAPVGVSGLYFHPLPKPVRLLETRAGFTGCFAPAAPLPVGEDTSQQARVTCEGVTIPDSAQAIVGNATTVGPAGLGYLTLFPASASRPLVATSNYGANEVINGPFTVGLSPAGEFNIFTSATTDLVVDVLGYYSPEATDINGAGLLFSPLPRPVRLLETRAGFNGCFAPGSPILGNQDYLQQALGVCEGLTIPNSALGIVGNATVVNSNGGYLTLWPSNANRPLVATSNFNPGQIVNRHFTVGLGPDGKFGVYSQLTTGLVVDVSGYFVP